MYSIKKDDENKNTPQNSLLSLMDGVDKTKRLLILTENNTWDINDFMLNRPSRIYYHFEYSKLPENSITDYCNDKNVSTDITKDIVDLARKSEIFSFDILQSIVEEHLRFGSSVKDVIEDLNVDVKAKDRKIQITKVIDKHTNEELKIHGPSTVSFNGYDFNFRVEQPLAVIETSKKAIGGIDIPLQAVEQINSFGIYMEEDKLAYQSNSTRVYENDNHTVVTKEIITQQSNYSQFI